MELGMIGLGRMGANMTQRLLGGGHRVVVYDRNPAAVAAIAALGAQGATSLEDLVSRLPAPRVLWMMIPAGVPVEQTIAELRPHLHPGDILVDGGNSNYKDSMRRGAELAAASIHYLDAGTSGGIWGLANGYCLMVGGSAEAFRAIEPVLKTLAPPDGYAYVGPSGAGHFAKMVHNGIEYGMLQALGEGFEILHASDFSFDLRQIAHLWNQGSVVRSWLLELAERAFEREGDLASIRGYVEDSGEGRWTVQEAIDRSIPAPVITLSLLARFQSRQEASFAAKVIAALRNEFGGHAVKPAAAGHQEAKP
ncbi:MAG: phosphogluconate dehydrogenase (NAD(+)-dependent, decarboxylating) [Chthonomonadales bacterium]